MKKIILLILLMASITKNANSQTVTGIVTQVPCINDGVYTVTTAGLSLPITYTYYHGGTTTVHSNVNSVTDQLTNFSQVGNSNYISCQVTAGNLSLVVSTSFTPSFTFSTYGSSPLCPVTMGTVTATQINGSPGPFDFSWTNDQTLVSYSGNNISVPIGEYSVIITDNVTGCVLYLNDSTAAFVNQLSNVTASLSTTPASCTNGSLSAIGSGGTIPYSYQWVNGATTSSINGLSQGYYGLTVTDNQGCQSNNLGAYVQQNPITPVIVTPTNATCLQNNGSAIAFGSGGVPPYTYAWSNGQVGNTATNLTGLTSYNVLATDANGCIGSSSFYINTNTLINVTYTTTVSQCNSPTGSATLSPTGGTAPYTYNWNVFPAVSTSTLSNVAAGTYSFEVTDAVGCVRTGSVIISPIGTINGYSQGSNPICPNNIGTAAVYIYGSNPPFTYLWNTGATTSQITGVPLGTYSCLITDALGCTNTKSASVINVSPINLSVSTIPVTCIFNTDGSATPNVTGGLAPYTYLYSNGTTNANAVGLAMGNMYVTVTDANNCSKIQHFQIGNANTNTNCYCTISGNVYLDANADCNFDVGENGIENIMIHCSGYGYTFTDSNGYYSFQVPTGTYTITEQVNAYYPLTACQSNSTSVTVVAASGCNTVVDIANDISTIHDLKIVTINSTLPPIPGNNYQQKVIVKNMGTVTEAGVQLGYEHDGQLSFVSSNSLNFLQLNAATSPFAYGIQAGFTSLPPSALDVMLLNYNTPINIPLGTSVNFYDTVANVAPINVNWLLDYTPWDNVNAYETVVIGSYDPNYKEVSPKGIGNEGYIPSTITEFDYTIHFQNEGTYFAQNISVTDQLDDDLDWTTLVPGYSDYNYTTTVSETGLVTFTFANINLPWKSNYGDALSSGLINYSIKRKGSNPQGTVFTNTANIFFDYNAPITTNTTTNTLNDEMSGVDEVLQPFVTSDITLDLFPIPAKDYLTIQINNVSKNEVVVFSIIDLMGKVVMFNRLDLDEGSTIVTQNVSSVANGTYLTRVEFDDGTFIVKKIILNK